MRSLGIILVGIVLAVGTAVLSLSGAPDLLKDQPVLRGLMGLIVGIGAGAPYVVFATKRLWNRQLNALQPVLQNHAERIRETLLDSGSLKRTELGVHVYVAQRRYWPVWRHEMKRVARAAWHERIPGQVHQVFRQNWRPGRAPGVIGLAWRDGRLWRINLGSPEVQNATEKEWATWLLNADPRARSISYQRFRKTNWFSTVWAQPTADHTGKMNGMITVNVELEASDGYERLLEADAEQILYREARIVGLAIN